MNGRELIAAFDVIADAPDGVKRLRELVLQLAVRGRLVAQEPGDTRVAASRSPPAEGEVPFELPETWRWLRLPEVAEYSVGKTPATKEPRFWGSREIPWVSIGDMPDGGIVATTSRTVTSAAASEVFRRPPAKAGTLLMSFKLTIGKIAVLGVDAYHNEAIISVLPNERVRRDYLFRVLPMMALGGESKNAIMGATLNGQSLARILIPLPSLAEQHRIVARVDELMGLLDRLEAARDARDDVRRAARDAALAALRDAEDTDAVEAAWGRIAGQMDELFTDLEDVGALRQAVLQLAVRGRLVGQDPRDEPAETLFPGSLGRSDRSGVKRGFDADAVSIDVAHMPFKVPSGWTWIRLGDISEDMKNGLYKPESFRSPDGALYLRMYNIQDGRLDWTKTQRLAATSDEVRQYALAVGDLVLSRVNSAELVGKAAIVRHVFEPTIFEAMTIRVRLVKPEIAAFVNEYLRTSMARTYFMAGAKRAVGQASINQPQVAALPIPLPPLAEQHRIVVKVDALMALCDALEARLTAARDLHAQFAAAAVHHLDV